MYVLVFAGIQMLVGALVPLAYQLLGKESVPTDATMIIIATAVPGMVTFALFLKLGWAEVSRHWVRTRPWFVLFWCVSAALGALILSSWLQEQMPQLPNWAENEFDMILRDRWGYIVIGLLAPLVEELVFRGAVLKALLQWKQNPWVGISISALLFALIHMNPAQMLHAFLIGLLLGWFYWRTDSIVPGVVYHWVNNTAAYVMYAFYPDPNLTLLDLFGSQHTVLLALLFSLCIFLPSLYQLNLRLKK